jgi:hypothetical protein
MLLSHVATACCYRMLSKSAARTCPRTPSHHVAHMRASFARCLHRMLHHAMPLRMSGLMAAPCPACHFACCFIARCATRNMHPNAKRRASPDECFGRNPDENLGEKRCEKRCEQIYTRNPVQQNLTSFSHRFSQRFCPRCAPRLRPRFVHNVFHEGVH